MRYCRRRGYFVQFPLDKHIKGDMPELLCANRIGHRDGQAARAYIDGARRVHCSILENELGLHPQNFTWRYALFY